MSLFLKTVAPIFIVSLLLIAARSTDEPFDCADLSCWDGIFPGHTTFNDAKKLLEYYHGESNVTANRADQLIRFHGNNPLFDGHLRTNLRGRVFHLRIEFQQPTMRISDVVSKLGEPTSAITWGFGACGLTLLYFEEHSIIIWPSYQYSNSPVKPWQMIETMEMYSPEYDALYYIYDKTIIDWQGYRDYCEFHIFR